MRIHYNEVENMYEDMRGWHHDFKNHLQILKGLTIEGDLHVVKEYLNQLEVSLVEIEPRVKTGNKMTDAILNSKISLAKSNGIQVTADALANCVLTNNPVIVYTWNSSSYRRTKKLTRFIDINLSVYHNINSY